MVGDTLQLGASKREYRLHWLSLSEAFEMEDLLPPLVEEDKEELHTHQVDNSLYSVQNLKLFWLCWLGSKCLMKLTGGTQSVGTDGANGHGNSTGLIPES